MYGLARPFLFGLDPERAHALGLAVLMFASATAWAETPTTFMGQPVHTMEMTVRGTSFALHATDGGFIPESTDRFTFDQAGHEMRTGNGNQPPGMLWDFGLKLQTNEKPMRVRIEEIGKDVDTLLVDDTAPVVEHGRWSGHPAEGCDIVRGAACAAWIFSAGPQPFVFRATVSFDDGVTQTLYQGASFDPGQMKPVWKALGVKR